MHLPSATQSPKTSQRYVLSVIYNCVPSPCKAGSVVAHPTLLDNPVPSRLFLRRNSDLIFFVLLSHKLL